MRLLVVQSHPEGTLGVLAGAIAARSIPVDLRIPIHGEALPDSSAGYGGLILLGGAMNAMDDDTYPHLRHVVELIHQFRAADKPILGICLGSQLIARAFGQSVYRCNTPEIGFLPLSLEPEATHAAPWLSAIPNTLHAMQWHHDTFDLPDNAVRLMSSETCLNQAFKIGDTIYGVQFHPEVNFEMLQRWVTLKDDAAERLYTNFEDSIIQQARQYLSEATYFCDRLADAWLEYVKP
ncbi:MAG: type 1 glutamine amidotransferase [Elainellaceae cyanobacterium]